VDRLRNPTKNGIDVDLDIHNIDTPSLFKSFEGGAAPMA